MTLPEPPQDRGAIAFAEKLLALLAHGSFSTTYKYAVLLALMDLCLERTNELGHPPERLGTEDLARKIIDLYWSHTVPFREKADLLVQCRPGQAEIVSAIERFRQALPQDPFAPLSKARAADPGRFERLVRTVEWKLIEMPLPRLQRVGTADDPFIYRIGWKDGVKRADAMGPAFDRTLHLQGRSAEYLVQLVGLLRPLIQREWAAMVARFNRDVLLEAPLEEFLFGRERISTEPVRKDLRELQNNLCFYCTRPIHGKAAVDHFVPWSRYPDNSIENLVVADPGCNGAKSDFLAAPEHLTRWRDRLLPVGSIFRQLAEISQRRQWERSGERTENVARAIYLRLPEGAKLWQRGGQFAVVELPALRRALGDAGA